MRSLTSALARAMVLAAADGFAQGGLEELFGEHSYEVESTSTLQASETLTRFVHNFDAVLLMGGTSRGCKL